jgi:lycopene beta-cyclase
MKRTETTAASIDRALKEHPTDAGAASAAVWGELWTPKILRQRDFANFGGEYLEEIGLSELRDFFGAFFVLPFKQWGGFLSHRLIEPYDRLVFGLGVWNNTTWRVRLSLGLKGFLSGRNPNHTP